MRIEKDITIKSRIRKNAIKKIENILRNASRIEYYTRDNNYCGEYGDLLDDRDVEWIVGDIKEGHANMYEIASGYMIRYAGRCKWIIE